MADFPASAEIMHASIGTHSPQCIAGQFVVLAGGSLNNAGAWPTPNRAIYTPITIRDTVLAYAMSFEVAASAGNYDVGIYDEGGARLVSVGSTAVPAAGIAVANITDTILPPGTYYLAMVLSTSTTLTTMRSTTPVAEISRALGMRQEALGATTLPATATFATVASAYLPKLCLHVMQATV